MPPDLFGRRPREDEVLQPNRFQAVVERPKDIFRFLRDYLGSDIPDLGILQSETGLFARMRVPTVPSVRGYSMFFDASHRPYSFIYWPSQDVDRLRKTLEDSQKNKLFVYNDLDGQVWLAVNEQTEQEVYDVRLGYPSERAHWSSELRSTRSALDPETQQQFPLFDLAEDFLEEQLEILEETDRPIQDDSYTMRVMVKPVPDNPLSVLPLLDENAFTRKLKKRAAFFERLINGIAEVKKTPQPGILVIRPPSINTSPVITELLNQS